VLIRGPQGAAGIRIAANFVTIDGPFDIVAPRDDGIEGNGVHHAVIRGVIAHDCGESGIQFNWSEFLTIENCITYRNARLSWYSGISVYQCREIGGAGPEPRTVIRGNVCYDNWTFAGAATDGNGIIVDDNNSTQDSGFPAWRHQTLVENNLCFRNGGKGIAIAWSDFTTVRRNTTFGNNGDPRNTATWRGDISVQSSRDCTVTGNIAVADPTTHASSTALGAYGGENARNIWSANIAWPTSRALNRDGANNQFGGTTIADPQLPGTTKPKPAQGTVAFVAADWLPAAAPAADKGWRPAAVVIEPEDPEEPEEPTVMELAALLAALQTTLGNVQTRLAALEARPTDPEIAARVAAMEAAVAGLKAFDQKIIDL
jgi:parallel beta-helix repeat protein